MASCCLLLSSARPVSPGRTLSQSPAPSLRAKKAKGPPVPAYSRNKTNYHEKGPHLGQMMNSHFMVYKQQAFQGRCIPYLVYLAHVARVGPVQSA